MSSFMDAWKRWSQRQFDRWGSKLQDKADKIQAMEFPDDLKKVLKSLSEALPEQIAKSLMDYIINLYQERGPKFAEDYIRTLIKYIKTIHF